MRWTPLAAERDEIRAWRWTFLVSGLEHPKVVKVVQEITNEGPAKIRSVVQALSA
jgi:hypothetical protein